MKKPRHSFAALTFGDILNQVIYVYGGIVGKLDGSNKPILADVPIERFDIQKNLWEILEIDNAPKLAAFGWAYKNDADDQKLFIVGGTDGSLLQSQTWSIDVKNKKVDPIFETDGSTALNKVAYIKNEEFERLYIIGGVNSAS